MGPSIVVFRWRRSALRAYRSEDGVNPRIVRWLRAWGGVVLGVSLLAGAGAASPTVPLVLSFENPQASDQDDMCIWVHPEDPALSLVIGSDKSSGRVFSYDLDGNVLQTIQSPKPGNIDVRYGISLGGVCVDLVAFNERDENLIRVYRVDPVTRMLERVDDGAIGTGSNYGFTLHKPSGGNLYAITGPTSGRLKQYLLFESVTGQVSGSPTGWQFEQSTVEGMVGDDETGYVYLSEERAGIWKVNAFDATDASMIARVGDSSGLQADVEGIAIYYAALGQGYIIASSQGVSKLTVFERLPPHAPVGDFHLDGVGSTDGVEVLNMSLNGVFTEGILLAHNGRNAPAIAAARWQDVVAALPEMQIDTAYWDPRVCRSPASIQDRSGPPTARIVLHPNSPNPANPTTRIRFTARERSYVRVGIYDLRGRRLSSLADGLHAAGTHEIEWRAVDQTGRALPSGIYLCRLNAAGLQSSIKITVTK